MLSLVDPKLKTPQALCIVPTLELAFQIFGVTEKLATDTGIKVEAILKGSKWDEKVTSQSISLLFDTLVLIGTPGKIEDLIKSKKKLLSTKDIKLVVFDEADEMLKPS
jgi:ATP-dependent RNA helicase DDX19/DBP5